MFSEGALHPLLFPIGGDHSNTAAVQSRVPTVFRRNVPFFIFLYTIGQMAKKHKATLFGKNGKIANAVSELFHRERAMYSYIQGGR